MKFIKKTNSEDNLSQNFNFDNSFFKKLESFFSPCKAEPSSAPKLLVFNKELAIELGLNPTALDSKSGLAVFSGNSMPEGSKPIAQAYAGHQFGYFSPQLGDGRALLLGEIIDSKQNRRDIQLKGSGRTPFSRGGDGKAALGPVLREYLISEAMHALGVPTTRALAAVTTGNDVYRERALPGAILTRVAASHIRVGTFQFGVARGDKDKVRELADYSIARHFPNTALAENPYLAFFEAVSNAQAILVARWMNIGFIHGVMNTDNMTISGETIDYGPCAFMDSYASDTVFSSIDRQGRYAYANQPAILSWNLTRFAETLIPYVSNNKEQAIKLLTDSIERIQSLYTTHWLSEVRTKLGLSNDEPQDLDLINDLLLIMENERADFTLVFRRLSKVLRNDSSQFKAVFKNPNAVDDWIKRWHKRIKLNEIPDEVVAKSMDLVNPIYIPRNHKVEEALFAAVNHEDLAPFSKLLAIIRCPFNEENRNQAYATPAPPSNTPYQTFCGT